MESVSDINYYIILRARVNVKVCHVYYNAVCDRHMEICVTV
jgi:hypothetical protein